MNGVVTGTLVMLSMIQQTDTVFPAEGAEWLDVEAPGGSIVVTVWDRDEVRIQAEHSRRTHVDVRRRRQRIDVEAEARRGPATIVDFAITIPRSMSVRLDGMYTDLRVEGVEGEVDAESVQGDVTIRGGSGSVKASSMTGHVVVEGARGTIEVESAAEDVRIVDSSGDILVESTGGNIILEGVSASSVDVGSVGGRIRFDGEMQAGGSYFFGTHGGSITIAVPDGTSATFHLSTIHGSISSNLPGAPQRFERGERVRFAVGGGGALVEAETFGGRISVIRSSTREAPDPAQHMTSR